jgi:hypothetical protein
MINLDYFHYHNFTVEITYFPEYNAYDWQCFDGQNFLKKAPDIMLETKDDVINNIKQEIDNYLLDNLPPIS